MRVQAHTRAALYDRCQQSTIFSYVTTRDGWVRPPLLFRPFLRLAHAKLLKSYLYLYRGGRVGVYYVCRYIVTFYCSPARKKWWTPTFLGLATPLKILTLLGFSNI